MVKPGRTKWQAAVLAFALLLGSSSLALARISEEVGDQPGRGPLRAWSPTAADFIEEENRTVDVGLLWMTITNFGYFGNDSPTRTGALLDPCTDEWAPQAEYPGGSDVQYLYRGGLWVGAMIQEEGFEYPRVTHGTEGWFGQGTDEFSPTSPIVERTTRLNAFNCLGAFVTDTLLAVSEQDFITSYADTSTVQPGGASISHPLDGPHVPLGIEVTQKTYAWSYNYAQDFIIIDYEIENIADKFLKNLYIGLYVDADIGMYDATGNHYEDDICGFTTSFPYQAPGSDRVDTLTINTAWIADNDGRPDGVGSGTRFTAPDITGSRVVRAPNPKLRTSFNWWISNGDQELDFGPAWVDDNSPGDWTGTFGTPRTDADKYFVLSNREFDYDQYYVDDYDTYIVDNPQVFRDRFTGEIEETHDWREPDGPSPDLADGYDTRYLISWGPLGIYDFTDDAGNRVYRLNPGEKFSMTVAYVAGANFHDKNNPQPTDTNIDPSKFNFADFQYNADWAAKVYDNPMNDTPMRPGSAEPLALENGGIQDGWFGEDVGVDQCYIPDEIEDREITIWDPGTQSFVTLTDEVGRDEGELDGILQAEEDIAPRPALFDYTYNNQLFDQGDGVPDFQGPPPPPAPVVRYRTEDRDLILTWDKNVSENPDYQDAFSRQQDFEGYRIYVSNTGQETEYSFLAEFDRIDYSFYTTNDSLLDSTYTQEEIDLNGWTVGQTRKEFGDGIIGYLQPVGNNIGLDGILMTDGETYEYRIPNANPMVPRYYAVTAYDYGDYRSGTEPLESAKSASAVYAAPAGSPRAKPAVVPNPYRADVDYTRRYLQLAFTPDDTTSVSWENRNDGTNGYFPQTDRRIYFYNLPEKCLIRIFTVSGDLVDIIEHDVDSVGGANRWSSPHAESWDLNSRNQQQVVSGLYIFSVEDMTEENKGHIDLGKFVIIR